ncbi:iron-containing alcohol dehydrogenase [bacterium]|nr:iron-containing alcohol dehydrogenase [bacterium]
MKTISQFLPVKVIFGTGSIEKLGEETKQYGSRVLLVTRPWSKEEAPHFEKAKALLEAAGLYVVVYDKVVPNPTTTTINEASEIVKAEKLNVVVGVGGGSTIDTAKAVAVGATHEGEAWDYVYSETKTADKNKTLPIIAVTTTSGTGSHVTKYAVFSNPDVKVKSTIVNEAVFPRVAIVDPDLLTSMDAFVTATTGFDAFAHAFESYTNVNANRFMDTLMVEAMDIILNNLRKAVAEPENKEVRALMAYADTLAGMGIANVGTTLPHSIGQPISGKCPWVSHGQSLALVYPEFLKFEQDFCVAKAAKVARLANKAYETLSDEEAASHLSDEIIKLQKDTKIYTSLKKLNVPKEYIEELVRDAMNCPDTYVVNHIPTADEVRQMLLNMWEVE